MSGPKMKAWSVSDRDCNLGFSVVIFAETRGKAIRYALDYCDGAFDWCTWTDMRAIRKPALDRFYDERCEMDWYNMADRVAMVRYAGFVCSQDSYDSNECERCGAREWCDTYASMRDD